jgi:hypothetical protein
MRTEILEQEASKVATAAAREVVPQLVSTEVQSPDAREAAKAQEKEKRRRTRRVAETKAATADSSAEA